MLLFTDGKHIRIQKPSGAESEFFSYKKFNSINLMAMSDAKYRFIWADVGCQGSSHDSYVFNSSRICRMAEDKKLNIPDPEILPNSDVEFPYFMVADGGFALRKWCLKPYAARNDRPLDIYEKEYNYRFVFYINQF